MAIEIAIQSPYDTKVGAGPITTGRNWRSHLRMNKIGAFSFEMPLNDPRRSYLVQKRYVRCYGMVNDTRTELGKPGIIDSVVKEMDANGVPTGMLKVSGRDLLAELADINIHELSLIDTETRIPDAVQYYDGTATAYLNMANTFDGNDATGVAVPADDEDWIYVGDADPFDIVDWHLGTNRNSDPGNFSVQYSQGASSWGSGTVLSDTTKANKTDDPDSPGNWGASWWKVDGQIRWERQEDWATDTVNSVANMYWLRFRYSEDMTAAANGGTIDVNEIEIIQEIPTATALADWLAYTDAASGTPMSDLGWDFEATHTATENTVFLKLRDVSAFEALALIGEQTGENFRLGTGRLIEWLQDDKTASGIRATNVPSGIAAQDNEAICLITNLRETEDSYEVVSRVYPQGGGRGATRIILSQCTETPPAGYTLSKTANYLKKDSVEEATPTGYGRRIEMTKFWPSVTSPNWASSWDINSSNALYKLAYEYLSRHWEPQKSYQFSVVKLDAEVKAGETVQLHYWQTVGGVAVWDLGIATALHLWVLEVTQAIDDVGVRVVAMQVATIDAWPSSDAGKVRDAVKQIKSLQSTEGPVSAASLTASTVAALLGSLDLSAYYRKPTATDVILGFDAGNSWIGVDSILVGYRAGYTCGDEEDNVAIGSDAMRLATASFNVSLGTRTLEDAGTTSGGDGNVAIGYQAMMQQDTGSFNVAIGASAMLNYVSGDCNVAIGEESMESTAGSGGYNTAVGYLSMEAITEGHSNVAVGSHALVNITTGDYNIAIGREAMAYNAASSNNIVIGYRAGYKGSATTYDDCVLIGYQAGYVLETGDNNVLIGHQAGLALTGAANVFIGYLAGSQAVGVSNQLYIENSNSATPLIYGEFDNDLVRINGDLCLGSEDGGGRLNFTEGTTIADGIVWGSDANKVTLYRSADDMLKTDDSMTVALGFNVGTATGAPSGGLALQDGITAPDATAGAAKIYVDTADGDLKIRFGDGTIKTIVVDT